MIAALDDARAGEASAFRAGELSMLEMHHYSARHVQHHAAQLNLLLRQGGVTPPRWVARGRPASWTIFDPGSSVRRRESDHDADAPDTVGEKSGSSIGCIEARCPLSLRRSGGSFRRTLCVESCESRMDAGSQSLLIGNLSQQRRHHISLVGSQRNQ